MECPLFLFNKSRGKVRKYITVWRNTSDFKLGRGRERDEEEGSRRGLGPKISPPAPSSSVSSDELFQ